MNYAELSRQELIDIDEATHIRWATSLIADDDELADAIEDQLDLIDKELQRRGII